MQTCFQLDHATNSDKLRKVKWGNRLINPKGHFDADEHVDNSNVVKLVNVYKKLYLYY